MTVLDNIHIMKRQTRGSAGLQGYNNKYFKILLSELENYCKPPNISVHDIIVHLACQASRYLTQHDIIEKGSSRANGI